MKKNILIYDDDEEILFLCKAILGKFGFIVETLSRCENILNDIKSKQPHLILMDLWIPEDGGEKAIATLKENEATKTLSKFIYSTPILSHFFKVFCLSLILLLLLLLILSLLHTQNFVVRQ